MLDLTLKEIVGRELKKNVSHFSVVRQTRKEFGKDMVEAGILVVLMHDAAVRELGPMLARFTKQIPEPTTANYVLTAEKLEDSTVAQIFHMIESRGLHFGWSRVEVGGLESTVVAVVGNKLSYVLAKKLTETAGCPTSFYEGQNPPEWLVWEVGDEVEAVIELQSRDKRPIPPGTAGIITRRWFGDQAPLEVMFPDERLYWVFPEFIEGKLHNLSMPS